MVFETDRLILREYTQDDFDSLYEIMSDPETMQHYPAPFDKDRTMGWITWNLENYEKYGFGDAAFWMQLHEEMRQAGFYIKTVEESFEHFAIMDQEIVWYGNMNLLAKNNAEDSIMRVKSKKIAMELMGLTLKYVAICFIISPWTGKSTFLHPVLKWYYFSLQSRRTRGKTVLHYTKQYRIRPKTESDYEGLCELE